MLSIMDVAALALTAFSPSKTCKVRVSSTRYRHDPYRARVFSAPFLAPARLIANYEIPSVPVVTAPRSPVAPMNWAKLIATAAPPASTPTAAPSPVKVQAPVASVAAAKAAPATASVRPAAATAAVPAATAGKPHFALIGFKHEATMYQAPFRVAVGDVVVVEADRGEHIGVVQEVTVTAPKYNVPCRVVRHASKDEYNLIDDLTIKEKTVTASIQKLAESLGLGIRVVDTEFQMDKNKLTVFFSSKVFVDFRKLQRGLFREFRCRIWLVNWTEVRPYTPVSVNPCTKA